eukprot:10916881-Lingulodinium_polyedra.AAC.1
MRTVKAKVQEIWTDYIAEFAPERASQKMPNATLDTHAADNVQRVTEIRIWLHGGQQSEKTMKDSVQEYIASTIVFVQCDHETGPIEQRLARVPFASEPGRKLFARGSWRQDP